MGVFETEAPTEQFSFCPDGRMVVRMICTTDIIYTTVRAWHTSLSQIPDLLEVSEMCVLECEQHKILVR